MTSFLKYALILKKQNHLFHPKYSHLAIDNTNNYDVEYKIFNSDNKLVIFKKHQFVGLLGNT